MSTDFNLATAAIPQSAITKRDLWIIGIATVAVRVLYIVIVCGYRHFSIQQYLSYSDGAGYLAYMELLLGHPVSITEYETRFFPGMPGIVALIHFLTGLPLWLVGVVFCIACAVVASVG